VGRELLEMRQAVPESGHHLKVVTGS
jgi:hypothetical protein